MNKTLYERLGGAPGIAALVDDVITAHLERFAKPHHAAAVSVR